MQLGFIVVLVISIFIAIFAIQNGDAVTVDLFFASYRVSQALVILISVGLGAIVAGGLGAVRQLKKIRNIKDLNKKIKFIEEEKETIEENVRKLVGENKKLETLNVDLKSEMQKLEDKIRIFEDIIKNNKMTSPVENPISNDETELEEAEEIENEEVKADN